MTQLKVVGRGNSIDNMEQDVSALRKSLDMLKLLDSNKDSINFVDNIYDYNKKSNTIFEKGHFYLVFYRKIVKIRIKVSLAMLWPIW